jgi:hypothetical protein
MATVFEPIRLVPPMTTIFMPLMPVGVGLTRSENDRRPLHAAERLVLTAFGGLRPIAFPSAATFTAF